MMGHTPGTATDMREAVTRSLHDAVREAQLRDGTVPTYGELADRILNNHPLIAAAPDMLEALQRAAVVLHDLAHPASRSAASNKRGRARAREEEANIRAALDKAER